MRKVTTKDLHTSFKRVIDGGFPILITSHGEPVAVLSDPNQILHDTEELSERLEDVEADIRHHTTVINKRVDQMATKYVGMATKFTELQDTIDKLETISTSEGDIWE